MQRAIPSSDNSAVEGVIQFDDNGDGTSLLSVDLMFDFVPPDPIVPPEPIFPPDPIFPVEVDVPTEFDFLL